MFLKSSIAVKFIFLVVIHIMINIPAELIAQDKTEFINAVISEIKLNKGKTMGESPAKIMYIYSIEIPDDANIIQREKNFDYEIYPLYVTLALRKSNYKIAKLKIPYDAVIYREVKNSYASLNKQTDRLRKFQTEIIWEYEEQSKEFKQQLDGLKSLKDTDFENLYGTEDNFPANWKK